MSSSSKARQSSKPMFGGVSMPSRNGKPNSKRNSNNNNGRSILIGPGLRGGLRAPPGRLAKMPVSRGYPSGLRGMTNKQRQFICEDEFVADINGSVAFATTAFPMNPAQIVSFPWGSRHAALYEKYRVISLDYYYKRTVSEFATNGQTGKVIFSFDYDAVDTAPINKQQVEDSIPHSDCMPCESMLLGSSSNDPTSKIDLVRLNSQDSKYNRPGAQPANTDLKTYDGGNLYVSTVGNAAATAIGELHVRYCFELISPVLNVDVPLSGLIVNTVVSRAAPFTGTQVITGTAGVTATAATLTFSQVGQFLIAVSETGTAITDVAPTLTGTAASGIFGTSNFHVTAATTGMCGVLVNVTAQNQTVIFDFTATCTTLTACVLRIAPYTFALG